jgi:predicted RNA-binding protein with PUA-like domain
MKKNIDSKYNKFLKKATAKAMWSVLDEYLANTNLQDSKVTGDDLFFYLKTLRTLDK